MLGSLARDALIALLLAGMTTSLDRDSPEVHAHEHDGCRARAALEALVGMVCARLDIGLEERESALDLALTSLDQGADPLAIAGEFLSSSGAELGTYVRAGDGRTWHLAPREAGDPDRGGASLTMTALRAGTELIELGGGAAAWGRLRDGTMYIRIRDRAWSDEAEARESADGVGADAAYEGETLGSVAGLLADLAPREPVVIDVRWTSNACDQLLDLAGWFASEPTVAFHTESLLGGVPAEVHAVEIHPPECGGVRGPVVLLTGTGTGGSAEALTLATMRLARVTRIGAPTSGTCRPITEHALGAGWVLGLPFGRYLSWDRLDVHGVGIAPHIKAEVDDAGDAHDAALEASLAYIHRLRSAGLLP